MYAAAAPPSQPLQLLSSAAAAAAAAGTTLFPPETAGNGPAGTAFHGLPSPGKCVCSVFFLKKGYTNGNWDCVSHVHAFMTQYRLRG